MTNNTDNPNLTAAGYSTREIEEHQEHLKNAPAGSHFANALAFIVESLNDGDVESTFDIRHMDRESMMEFAEMYNFTEESLNKAMAAFSSAAEMEVGSTL